MLGLLARRFQWERSQIAKLAFVSGAITMYLVGFGVAGYAGLIAVTGELFAMLVAVPCSLLTYRWGQLWRSMDPALTRRAGVLALAYGRRPGRGGWFRTALLVTAEPQEVVLYEARLRGPRPVRQIPYDEITGIALGDVMDSTIRVVVADGAIEMTGAGADQAACFKAAVEARLPAPSVQPQAL
jgi:hypothetical protein